MLSLLQYITFYFNINMATFVGFQIAVYAYIVLRTFTHTSPSSRVNARVTIWCAIWNLLSRLCRAWVIVYKPLFQSSQKLVRSSLRVLAYHQKELTASKQALRVLFNQMQLVAASCESDLAMTEKEILHDAYSRQRLDQTSTIKKSIPILLARIVLSYKL